MQELERSVVRDQRRRKRQVLSAVTAVIALACVCTIVLLAVGPPPRVVVAHTPPVIVTVDRIVPAPAPAAPMIEPPPAPEPAQTVVTCPVLDPAADRSIGAAIVLDKSEPDEPRMRVVASAVAPRIAILAGATVFVSDDDGAHFANAFVGHDVSQIAVARDGTLYAIDGDKLGVRAFPGSTDVWRCVPGAVCQDSGECPWCDNRIAAVEERLYWFHNAAISVTSDQGRHWRSIPTDDAAWPSASDDSLLSYRGVVYQLEHYHDMCGVSESHVWRLARSGKIDHAIFHDYYESREPVLEPDDEVATAWRWRERCWRDDSAMLSSCSRRIPTVSSMLRVATLRPIEGARALAVYAGGLIELCEDGARQVYRAFPFPSIDAVDAQGRPLVVRGGELLRWSPVHGWRRLYRLAKQNDTEQNAE
jgi:hypothetical protein